MTHNPEIAGNTGKPSELLRVIARHPDITRGIGMAVVLIALADNVNARTAALELAQQPLATSDPGRLAADVVAAFAGFAIMSLPTYIRPPRYLQ